MCSATKGCGHAMAHRAFETGSSFHAEWHTGGRVKFLFFKSFLLVLAKLSFGGGTGHWAIILGV